MKKHWKVDYALKIMDGTTEEDTITLVAESIIDACSQAYDVLHDLMKESNVLEQVIEDAVVWNACVVEEDVFGDEFYTDPRDCYKPIVAKLAQLVASEIKNSQNIKRYLEEVRG